MADTIAVFWDFDALHSEVMALRYGDNWYKRFGTGAQPEVVDVFSIFEQLTELGAPDYQRLYCNWEFMGNYAEALQDPAIEMIQLWPAGRSASAGLIGKITADVHHAIEARGDDLKTVIVVGGGRAHFKLGREVKESGKQLIGIGVEGQTDQQWIELCDEWIPYSSSKEHEGGTHLSSVETLLAEAVQQLGDYQNTEWVQQVRIKPAMVRLDPNFDERDFGFESFSIFLRAQDHILERRHRPGEQEPEYRLLVDVAESSQPGPQSQGGGNVSGGKSSQEARDPAQIARYYLKVAGQQGIRMPRPEAIWVGIDIYASFLKNDVPFENFSELDQACYDQLVEEFPDTTLSEAKKIRQVLFKCFLFRPSDGGSIGFQDEIQNLEDIEDRYFDLMLNRIGNNVRSPLDYTALSLALTGTEDEADRLREMDAEQLG